MPTIVDRNRVRELLDAENAQLVEVLPRREYDEEHLPEAVHIPLKEVGGSAMSALDPARPVVVYCWDVLCDLSPRAASQLERFGLDVYDYAAGKADWIAAGLPTVAAESIPRRAIDVADRDPATCGPDTPMSDLPSDSDVVVVVDEDGIVLGRVRFPVDRDVDATAGEVMEAGPTTVRAHEPLDDLLERMRHRRAPNVIVTTPEGRLLGVVHQP
jgi:rhodanese-related sulfurtransferase